MIQVCFIMTIIVKRDSSLVGTNDVGNTGILVSTVYKCCHTFNIVIFFVKIAYTDIRFQISSYDFYKSYLHFS